MRVFVIKLLLHIFALLPLAVTHAIANILGRLLARCSLLRITKVTRTNINLCFPNLSAAEQANLVKHSLIETCKTFIEIGEIWLSPLDKVLALVREVEGEEYLQQALKQGRGVILLTPHFGAWEMAGLYASSRYNMSALYRPPKLHGLNNLIHTARKRAGGNFMPANRAGVRALFQQLRQGNVAGILPDQVPTDNNAGIFVPFFGVAAFTTVLVSRLANKTGASIIFTYAERLPKGKGFKIHFFPAATEITVSNLEEACTALNKGIEHCVEHCPAQYLWSYKRFKMSINY
jgi:KDO2-lipid IV(A) lauroyltransferase